MTVLHRHLHQWNQWLKEFLGQRLLDAERQCLSQLLSQRYGKHALLIGVEEQQDLLSATHFSHPVITCQDKITIKTINSVEGDFAKLPFASGRVDLVLLPHTFEYTDNPHKLLHEACRIVKPEGYIIIFGFNPYGVWRFNKFTIKNKNFSWKPHFIHSNKIKKWLQLADFELVKQQRLLYRPPIDHPTTYQKLQFLEWLGKLNYVPFSGVYMLMAQAKVIPLTPIKLRWKQQIPNARISLTGPTAGTFR